MVIDIHVHTFPEKIASRAVTALAASSSLKPACDGTAQALSEAMRCDGIDLSVMQPIATSPRNVVKLNDAAIENDRLDGFLSFGAMHPAFDDIKGELKRIKEAGIKGVKLHPDFQHIFLDDERCVKVIRACAELDLIVLIHGGLDISYPEKNRSTPGQLAAILPRCPGAKIIFAHLGGYGYFSQAIRCLSQTGIYIDTSAIHPTFPASLVYDAVKAFGADRVLFGSDSPWASQGECADMIRSLPLTEGEKERILGANAVQLLGL